MAEQASTGGTVRLAAKVILIDRTDRVLLFRGGDPTAPEADTWWFPPGGGLEPGETSEQAARREVLEETGLTLDEFGPVIFHRHAEFTYNGIDLISEEDYFLVKVDRFKVSTGDLRPIRIHSLVVHGSTSAMMASQCAGLVGTVDSASQTG